MRFTGSEKRDAVGVDLIFRLALPPRQAALQAEERHGGAEPPFLISRDAGMPRRFLAGGAFSTPSPAARTPPDSGENADATAQTKTATASFAERLICGCDATPLPPLPIGSGGGC